MGAVAELLTDAFGRVRENLHGAVDGLTEDELEVRLDADANSIAWLAWHLTRVQDDHVAGAFGVEQVWPKWRDRFGMTGDPTGYGDTTEQVARVRASGELLTAYHDAVYQQTLDLVSGVDGDDLARVVDERWDPPVTLSVRLVSVISDCLQHAGSMMFIRGVLERR
ncbi:MAG TPA: DUF664 domain-containing protein [Streptosporangiaceae bacterium]